MWKIFLFFCTIVFGKYLDENIILRNCLGQKYYMCVCVYVCVCVYLFVCMYVSVYLCFGMCFCTCCVCVYECSCVYVFVNVCMCECV